MKFLYGSIIGLIIFIVLSSLCRPTPTETIKQDMYYTILDVA